jgi:hypothetical protein
MTDTGIHHGKTSTHQFWKLSAKEPRGRGGTLLSFLHNEYGHRKDCKRERVKRAGHRDTEEGRVMMGHNKASHTGQLDLQDEEDEARI